MARGFLSGVILGGVVSVGAAGVISVLAPLPMSPAVSDAAPGVATPAVDTQRRTVDGLNGQDESLATGPTVPQTPAPAPDTISSLDPDTMRSAAQPETGSADNLTSPAPSAETGGVSPEGDEPVLPNPQALAPMAPEAADEVSISTEPAQPPQPSAEAVSGAFDDPAQPELPPEATPEADLAEADVPQMAPEAPAPTDAEPAEADAAEGSTEEALPEQAPEPPVVLTENAELPEAEASSPPEPATAQEAPAQDEPSAMASAAPTVDATTGPTIGTPPVNLLDRDSGVSIRRPGAETTSLAAADDAASPEAASDSALPPLERFAQDFTPEGDKPLMSIVLIDDGQSPTNGAAGIAALRSFPYPISFAVDSSLPDAAARMAMFRDAGFEVLAMIDLPEGARPVDVETAFAATLAQLPEVIGVLEGPSGSLQSARDVSDQVTEFLAGSGHGWVTQAKGLNTAANLARREGVPARAIFRDFDSKDQTAVVIRRFLDQAAFKAAQEDGVIMLGRLRPETITALLLWGLQDRAGQVALAPVSTILMQEEG